MSKDKIDFVASLKELEDITTWFESEDIDLDKGLAKFERGMLLATELKEHLKQVENRVEVIKRKFTDSKVSGAPEPEIAEPELFEA